MANFTTAGSDTFPAGHVLQIQQYAYTGQDSWATSVGTWRDMHVEDAITLSNVNNKVLVVVSMMVGASNDGYMHYRLRRNGSDIINGQARGSCTVCSFMADTDPTAGENYMEHCGITYLDDPSETTIQTLTYNVYGHNQNGAHQINRCNTASDANRGSPVSTITLMEISV
jgi:hypothetical protein